MNEWAARRFWTRAEAVPEQAGFTVRLDGRPVKTPAKAPLVMPARPLAEAVADEWAAQDGVIDPGSMPFTRMANSAIDKVAAQRDVVEEMLASYGGTDLLCYRAESPEGLRARQDAEWAPLLSWAEAEVGASLLVTYGVMPMDQPRASLEALRARLGAMSHFELTALHDLVVHSGSLVLGLAVAHRHAPAARLWTVSRIDEDWQAALWGEDEEAAAQAEAKRQAFLHAERFLLLARGQA